MKDITISVVDDEPDVRAAICLLLKSVGHKVQSYGSALEFWDSFDPGQSGCLILDVRMPGMSGLDLRSKLGRLIYHPPIIMVSGHGEIPMAVTAVKSSVIDFLQKPFSDQLLLDRVNQAIEKDSENRQIAIEIDSVQAAYEQLISREREVLKGVAEGKLNKVIAHELSVSTRTVEIHRSNMMEKMSVISLASLMRRVAILEDNNIFERI